MKRGYEDVFPDECSEHMKRGYEDVFPDECSEHMKRGYITRILKTMFPPMNVESKCNEDIEASIYIYIVYPQI